MRFSTLVYLYGRRLRKRAVQELLAGLGIAVGVALVFAVLVANSSVTTGSAQIVKSLAGRASLQLVARSDTGFDEAISRQAQALASVKRTAPLLYVPGTVQSATGHVAVQVTGAELSLAVLDGLVARLPLGHLALSARVVMLPAATAKALGVVMPRHRGKEPLPTVLLKVRGRATRVPVAAVLGQHAVGPLANAMAVIAPLPFVQELTGLPGRATTVLVQPRAGEMTRAREELDSLAAGRLTVGPADEDVQLLDQATIASSHVTEFFAFVSAMVGFLLAFNAMLLSAPERRRIIALLRMQGARPISLVLLILFQALCLGVVASAAGVLAGEVLARSVFHQTPGYLEAAFMLGDETVIGWQPIFLSILGGVLATCLASLAPLLDLRRSRAVDGIHREAGEPGQALSVNAQRWLFISAILLIAATSGLHILYPSQVILATVGLALATLMLIPNSFRLLVRFVQRAAAARRGHANIAFFAARGCKTNTLQSLALAATGAIAVFGAVVVDGAHRDLLNGLYGDYSGYVSTAQLWVTNSGDDLATNSFQAGHRLLSRIRRVPGVAEARGYQGGFLTWKGRRVWLIARSPNADTMLPASQVTNGRADLAMARLRAGGWITVSDQIAQAAGVRIGQPITLPTPSGPVSYRVAATTTNLGWASGAVAMSDSDYQRAWGNADPSAIEITLTSSADTAAVEQAVRSTLSGFGGLRVQTDAERSAEADALAREGLSRLSQISVMLTIAAALAMAAAMGASIWQRRRGLASLKLQTFNVWQLRRLLLYESFLVLATGCAIGALAGVYGHLLGDQLLRLTTGFPAPFALGAGQVLQTLGLVVVAALVVLIVPGYVASQAPPTLALQE